MPKQPIGQVRSANDSAKVRLTTKVPKSSDKLAMAERIMNEDKGILRSLASADNFEVQIEVAYEVMERRKGALRALAKQIGGPA